MADINIPIKVALSTSVSEQLFELGASGEKNIHVPVAISNSIYTINTDGYIASTETWDSQPELVAKKNVVYIYTDHHIDKHGRPVPGFKVGDGSSYLIDMPFNDEMMVEHIENNEIHITNEEREFWNNKVTTIISEVDNEELIFTREKIWPTN